MIVNRDIKKMKEQWRRSKKSSSERRRETMPRRDFGLPQSWRLRSMMKQFQKKKESDKISCCSICEESGQDMKMS